MIAEVFLSTVFFFSFKQKDSSFPADAAIFLQESLCCYIDLYISEMAGKTDPLIHSCTLKPGCTGSMRQVTKVQRCTKSRNDAKVCCGLAALMSLLAYASFHKGDNNDHISES